MRRSLKTARVVLLLGIIVLAIALVGRLSLGNYPLAFLHTVLDPMVGVTLRFRHSAGTLLSAFTSGPRLQVELNDLQSKFNDTTQENARLLELRGENEQLRSALAFREKNEFHIAIARVVGEVHESGTNFFTLNKGVSDGVEIGDPILLGQVFVGKIVRVNSSSSVAAPLTAAGMRTAATLAGYPKNAGILEGELNLEAVLRFIPKDVTIHEGAPIVSSGLEEKIARGLLIGTVERVESHEQDLFQTAYLKITSQLEDASLLSIIITESSAR